MCASIRDFWLIHLPMHKSPLRQLISHVTHIHVKTSDSFNAHWSVSAWRSQRQRVYSLYGMLTVLYAYSMWKTMHSISHQPSYFQKHRVTLRWFQLMFPQSLWLWSQNAKFTHVILSRNPWSLKTQTSNQHSNLCVIRHRRTDTFQISCKLNSCQQTPVGGVV